MSAFEVREQGNGQLLLTGHASVFGNWYPVGPFRERIMPGAFSQTLRSSPDTILTAQHGGALSGLPIARTTSGTLRLSEDSIGLAVSADLDATDPDVQALVPKMKRGDLGEMSFAFRILGGERGQSWNDAYDERTIHAIDLDGGDVSVVTRGANRATSSAIRSDQLTVDDRRAVAAEIGFEVRGGFALAGFSIDERAGSPKYTQAEIDELGGQGKAFKNADGVYSFPIADRQDVMNAIHAIGRSGLTDKAPLRRFIIGRAKALNAARLIPAAWNADGSVRGARAELGAEQEHRISAAYLDELEFELLAGNHGTRYRGGRARRSATERDRHEAAWRPHRRPPADPLVDGAIARSRRSEAEFYRLARPSTKPGS